MALDALFTWVVFAEKDASTERVRGYVERNDLRRWMTTDERKTMDMRRAEAHDEMSGVVGWRLENMWPLAWVLGFEREPPFDGKMIAQEVSKAIVMDFLPGRAKVRELDDVVALEDLFYCAHNAARSAQLGHDTVPEEFDPIAGGGVVHERRHGLTWCLSPGVDWEDTDVSA